MTTERKADKWLDRKLERRALLKKAAIGSASLTVLYVAPKFSSVGSRPAYAMICGTCTPDFWKNHHDHIDAQWALSVYSRGDRFEDVFGPGGNAGFSTEFPLNLTLQQALEMTGGCPGALARHATAALLNASIGDIAANTGDIISDTDTELSGGPGNCTDILILKDGYDTLNNGACLDAWDPPEPD